MIEIGWDLGFLVEGLYNMSLRVLAQTLLYAFLRQELEKPLARNRVCKILASLMKVVSSVQFLLVRRY